MDSVEFELAHEGIEKLERNIEQPTEYIMCFVHFDAGTENLDGIYMAVWDAENCKDDIIAPELTAEEKELIVAYALEELRNNR